MPTWRQRDRRVGVDVFARLSGSWRCLLVHRRRPAPRSRRAGSPPRALDLRPARSCRSAARRRTAARRSRAPRRPPGRRRPFRARRHRPDTACARRCAPSAPASAPPRRCDAPSPGRRRQHHHLWRARCPPPAACAGGAESPRSTGKPGRLGFVGAARTERRDDERHARAVQHAHQLPRRLAVAGDDDVMLTGARTSRRRLGCVAAAGSASTVARRSSLAPSRAPSAVSCGVATISTTVAAMNACDPVSPRPAGDSPTSCPARSSTNENSPICASISAEAAATGVA